MDLIEYTINWCQGEIFEGKLVFLFGAVVLLVALLYWKFGATPFARAMVIPLLVVALLSITGGGYLVVNNQKRIVEFQQEWQADPQSFVASEKSRTESFIKWYPVTMYIMFALSLVGMGCYAWWGGAWGRAIGLALILLSLSGLFLDHFSEERAETYHRHIVSALE